MYKRNKECIQLNKEEIECFKTWLSNLEKTNGVDTQLLNFKGEANLAFDKISEATSVF